MTAPTEAPTQLFAKGEVAPTAAGERPDSPNVLNAIGDFSRRMFTSGEALLSTWGAPTPGDTVAQSAPAVELTPSVAAASAPSPAVEAAGVAPDVPNEEKVKRRHSDADANPSFDFENAPAAAEQNEGGSSARRPSKTGIARRLSTQTATVGRRASLVVAKAAVSTAAAPKKAIRKASVATAAFTNDVFDEFEELASGGERAALGRVLEKQAFDSKVDELVEAKMKKIIEERKEKAQKAAAAANGPEA